MGWLLIVHFVDIYNLYCNKIDIQYLCTPFSIKAAKELNSINVHAFKTGSGELTNFPFIDKSSFSTHFIYYFYKSSPSWININVFNC